MGFWRQWAGQLGDGTTIGKYSPVQIGTDSDWVSIAAGYAYTVALKSDGTLWAWGRNDNGQLGDGTTTSRLSPVRIGADNNWISIVAGAAHTIALKSDGTLWSWGRNMYGELGDGTTTERHSSVQIGAGGNWVSIAAGGYHSISAKSDGTLWAWGYNAYGQLGDGTTTDRYSPVRIASKIINQQIADFNGDGATDVAGFHLPPDQFFTDYAGTLGQYGWGGAESYPLVWDYDGDGRDRYFHLPYPHESVACERVPRRYHGPVRLGRR